MDHKTFSNRLALLQAEHAFIVQNLAGVFGVGRNLVWMEKLQDIRSQVRKLGSERLATIDAALMKPPSFIPDSISTPPLK
jgi:hypothetical protein